MWGHAEVNNFIPKCYNENLGKDENHVKELLMFVNGIKEMTQGQDITINGKKREIETVLLTLTGDIDLRQISKLTSQMNMPGGEQLKKAGKDKKLITLWIHQSKP